MKSSQLESRLDGDIVPGHIREDVVHQLQTGEIPSDQFRLIGFGISFQFRFIHPPCDGPRILE